jgi:ArsR family transcriptional regulator
MDTNLEIFEGKSEKLKAMAHPHRLCILRGLSENKCNVSKIQECLGLPQSTVSQHLAKLRAAGLIKGERNGQEICYKVADEDVKRIIEALFNE